MCVCVCVCECVCVSRLLLAAPLEGGPDGSVVAPAPPYVNSVAMLSALKAAESSMCVFVCACMCACVCVCVCVCVCACVCVCVGVCVYVCERERVGWKILPPPSVSVCMRMT
jgi:hypothetical protein